MKQLFFILASYVYLQANAHIFIYHRFGDDRHKSTNTTIKELEKEFQYFKDNNYEVVPLEYILYRKKYNYEIPSNWVALTIDDSFKSFYENAFPIFKKFKYPFSMYVYVEATQKKYPDFMTWDQLREVSEYGTLGLHSYGHNHLTHFSQEEVIRDTQKSYDIFEQEFGYRPTVYAFPFGEYNEETKNAIKQFNFHALLSQSTGSVTKDTLVTDIPRIALVGEVNIKNKLKYTTLAAEFIEPHSYPKDKMLRRIKAKVDPKIKTLKLYVTGHGWRDIKVNNGIVEEELSLKLKRSRIRIMLGTSYYNIANHLITK